LDWQAAFFAAALSASTRGAAPVGLPAVPARGEALANTHYRAIDVGGLEIFYREAGPAAAPVVLLLHGFPTSSRMFRNLIPMLADKYRVIAPDYPAFGHSAVPSRADFEYTHAHLSEVMEALLEMAKAPSSPLTSIILMPSDVEQITRRDRPTAQARILRLLGIPFAVHPGGRHAPRLSQRRRSCAGCADCSGAGAIARLRRQRRGSSSAWDDVGCTMIPADQCRPVFIWVAGSIARVVLVNRGPISAPITSPPLLRTRHGVIKAEAPGTFRGSWICSSARSARIGSGPRPWPRARPATICSLSCRHAVCDFLACADNPAAVRD
jgi:hypothetical protein